MSRFVKSMRVLFLSAPLVGAGGCGVELAVIGAAASAASQGSAVYKQGKLNVSWMGSFDRVVAAGEAAGSDLGLIIMSTEGDAAEGTWETVLSTRDGDKIVVRTTRKTRKLIQFQIDVGWFGSESTARLLLKRMAVAINLDAMEDGSGTVIPALPSFLTEPLPDPEPETPSDSEPDDDTPETPAEGNPEGPHP